MSEKGSKSNKIPASSKPEPGRASLDMKPKKAAAHRQVIEDAAKYNQASQQQTTCTINCASSSEQTTNAVGDDYEGGKVNKRKGGKNDEEIQMVRDLDRWG